MQVAIIGALGRMGQALRASPPQGVSLWALSRQPGSDPQAIHNLSQAPQLDLIIDFSSSGSLDQTLDFCTQNPCALLVGTTGLGAPQFERLKALSQHMPILYAANTAPGLNQLFPMAETLLRLFPQAQVEIEDLHHAAKKDAPSGTALALQAALRALKADVNVQITSSRAGQHPGRHRIKFITEHETLELHHEAHSRQLFAAGAWRAGLWLVKQAPAYYTMLDSLSA